MLMCYDHHKLIDTEVDEHSESLLLEMKREHEERMNIFVRPTDRVGYPFSWIEIVAFLENLRNLS